MSIPTPSLSITTPNYGVPLANEAWPGWRLRVSEHPASGKMEGLVAADDAVLIWTGGKSEVSLHARAEQQRGRPQFVRSAGMIDLLPKGIVFEEVWWRGKACTCVSVPFDAARV